MIEPGTLVYQKLEQLSKQLKNKFQKQGVVIPVLDSDGTLVLGRFRVKKIQGFYTILNYADEIIADKINLPQTAAILANDLALGKFLNRQILDLDREYGFADFEENLYRHYLNKDHKKNLSQLDVLNSKTKLKKLKKDAAKQEILSHFEKLRKFA